MRNAIVAIFLAAGTFLATSTAAAGDAQLLIRTYDMTSASETERARAVSMAGAILEDAGLYVVWTACETAVARDIDHPCLTRLRPNEVSVRFVRLPGTAGTRQAALGYSLVETQGRTGSLATIYVDRVARLASAAAMDVATVLGRAIAHEVGHLLLGTGEHSRTGVMRAVWAPVMLRRNRPGDWQFTESDARALRQAVQDRTPLQLVRN